MKNIVEMNHITKTFPGIIANDDVSLALRTGEIHALLGENGAGKSTLMSILFGMYQPDSGEIIVNGNKVEITNPRQATELKIGMVHQHFKLVDTFTVTENIILGVEEVVKGAVDKKKAREAIVQLSERYNLNVDPDAKIEDISVGMQQRVEILKLLYRESDVMIFDEPTAVLTPQEIEELMEIMLELQKEGKSIILITHKLGEIKRVANRCTVLRKGKYIGTVEVADVSIPEMSEMMVGRKVDLNIDLKPIERGDVVLSVENLSVESSHGNHDSVKSASFALHSGEIVSIAGIEGNGQRELVYAIAGMMPIKSGEIVLNGENIEDKSIRYRNTHGISHIPEDRHRDGLVLEYNLAYNLALKKYFMPQFAERGFLKFAHIDKYARDLIQSFDIRSSKGPESIARSMSGGNQQKAILAREIDLGSDVLMAVQPTRGLDVGAIEYIHNQLVAQRDAGKSVLLVSYELSEIMNVSDRILVIHDGELVGEFKPQDVTQQELGLYMAGAKRGNKNETI
ncbi:MAG: ABC transporter ATP-binding protein [Erysipelothrix sp.]